MTFNLEYVNICTFLLDFTWTIPDIPLEFNIPETRITCTCIADNHRQQSPDITKDVLYNIYVFTMIQLFCP